MAVQYSGSRSARAMTTPKPNRGLRRQRPHVLLVDDDPADQELVRRCVEHDAVDLTILDNGQDALDYFLGPGGPSRESPDLVLLDLNMPGKRGNEIIGDMRKTLARWVPIVVFSSSSDLKDMVECYEAGCSTYIPKPLDIESFRGVLEIIMTYWFVVAEN